MPIMLILLTVWTTACEGPMGPQGQQGEQGEQIVITRSVPLEIVFIEHVLDESDYDSDDAGNPFITIEDERITPASFIGVFWLVDLATIGYWSEGRSSQRSAPSLSSFLDYSI